MIDIKQYLKETNSVLLTERAYKYLTEKASVIEKLEEIKSEMDIIAELEAIKAEIEEIDNIVHEHGATYINKYGIVKVFNKHISELKGE